MGCSAHFDAAATHKAGLDGSAVLNWADVVDSRPPSGICAQARLPSGEQLRLPTVELACLRVMLLTGGLQYR